MCEGFPHVSVSLQALEVSVIETSSSTSSGISLLRDLEMSGAIDWKIVGAALPLLISCSSTWEPLTQARALSLQGIHSS